MRVQRPIFLTFILVAVESFGRVGLFLSYPFGLVLENVIKDVGPIFAKEVKKLFWMDVNEIFD